MHDGKGGGRERTVVMEDEEDGGAEARAAAGVVVGAEETGLVPLLASGAAIAKVENETMIQYAFTRPRDLQKALTRMVGELEAFPESAVRQRYSIPYRVRDESKAVECSLPEHKRVGPHTHVEGLSIKAAMNIGRCLGNLSVKCYIAGETDTGWTVEATVVDMETLFRVSVQGEVSKFIKKGQRFQKATEDEKRRLLAIEASKQIRNGILRIAPDSLKDRYERRAVEVAREFEATRLPPGRAGKRTRQQTIAEILKEFAPFGVGREPLEKYLGCPLEKIDADQGVDLRGIVTALKDGVRKAWEVFEGVAGAPAEAGADWPDQPAIPGVAGEDPLRGRRV